MSELPAAAALPAPLVTRDQWVAWRPQERDGKQTKVPVNPNTGQFASTTDESTWTDFATAREYATGKDGGLGFVFTETDPIVGVDLDDCRNPDTGSLTEEAGAIVDELDSYTEVSPSGTGVHVLVEGALPDGRNRRDWVECYEHARFFTVSGAHVEGTPTEIRDRTDELARIHGRHLAPDEADTPAAEEGAPDDTDGTESEVSINQDAEQDASLSDAAVVERAQSAANGDKFARLWNGNTAGYDSHSEADMALCAMLAFWTGRDTTQIDRLFRESGLMRPKWDERHYADGSTYGEKTIERVVASTDEVYQPGDTAKGAPDTDVADTGAVSSGSAESDGTGESVMTGAAMSSATETVESGKEESRSLDAPADIESTQTGQHSEAASTQDPTNQEPRSDDSPITDRERTTDEELLSMIEELQAEVERLESENKRLRQRLEEREDSPDAASDDSGLSPLRQFKRWVLR